MADSTLLLDYEGLRQRVGFELAFRRDSDAWTSEESAAVDDCVQSGIRQFYWPPPMQGVQHTWTFLKPTVVLALAASTSEVDLPDTCGGLEGQPTIETSANYYRPLRVVGEGMIRRWRSESPSITGTPQCVAELPLQATGLSGQKFKLLLFPTTDIAYSLRCRYRVLPNMVTRAAGYPWGGAEHAETILASCLAVAERRVKGEAGICQQAWLERLAASVALDQRRTADFLGYAGDPGPRRRVDDGMRHRQNTADLYYNGTLLE